MPDTTSTGNSPDARRLSGAPSSQPQISLTFPNLPTQTQNTQTEPANTLLAANALPSANPRDLDLSLAEDVRTYLAKTPFASTEVRALSGGTANYVFRLRLEVPYKGKETLVFKHAKPYVKDYHALAFGLERQIYEVEALRRVRAWAPVDSVVTVPEVYLFDQGVHAIVMDDTGADSVALKDFMKQGRPSLEMAQQIGAALGAFLGGMHRWGKGNQELCGSVKGNAQAKAMSAWAFYGRFKDTLTGIASDVPKLSDPPLEVNEDDLKVIDALVAETTSTIMGVEDSFVMGDFWPGNLMVALDEGGNLKHIYILDWELTKTGLTGIDVGQFCAEIHLLRRFHPDVCTETASLVLQNFFREYKQHGEPEVEDARRAVVQWGTHLVVLAGRVEWGAKELTREVVLEGVRMLVDGYKAEREGLRRSLVGEML